MAKTLPISEVRARLPDLMRQIRASERHFARGGKGWSFEEVFGKPLRRPKKRAR